MPTESQKHREANHPTDRTAPGSCFAYATQNAVAELIGDMESSMPVATPGTKSNGLVPSPSPKGIIDPEYWRQRAEEALEIAYEMTRPLAVSKMLQIVERYERLARLAEDRQRK